jgi:hypothetical protein
MLHTSMLYLFGLITPSKIESLKKDLKIRGYVHHGGLPFQKNSATTYSYTGNYKGKFLPLEKSLSQILQDTGLSFQYTSWSISPEDPRYFWMPKDRNLYTHLYDAPLNRHCIGDCHLKNDTVTFTPYTEDTDNIGRNWFTYFDIFYGKNGACVIPVSSMHEALSHLSVTTLRQGQVQASLEKLFA